MKNNGNDQTLDAQYWNCRWELHQTGWDIGNAAPAITNYLQQVVDKDLNILIPGCGNAYEAIYLLENGFSNITVIDFAPKVVDILKDKLNNYEALDIICDDFFNHEGTYDLIIEQTFFCAIAPSKRKDYVFKMSQLLKSNGKLVGLLFDVDFQEQGPPFGGNIQEYQQIFEPFFDIKLMEKCKNSIKPRMDKELFFILEKK